MPAMLRNLILCIALTSLIAHAGPKEDSTRMTELGNKFARIYKRVLNDSIERHGDVDRSDTDRLQSILKEVRAIATRDMSAKEARELKELQSAIQYKVPVPYRKVTEADGVPYVDKNFVSMVWVFSALMAETAALAEVMPGPMPKLFSLAVMAALVTGGRIPLHIGKVLNFFIWDVNHAPLLAIAQWRRKARLQKLQGSSLSIATAEPFLAALYKNRVLDKNGTPVKLLSECEALLALPTTELPTLARTPIR